MAPSRPLPTVARMDANDFAGMLGGVLGGVLDGGRPGGGLGPHSLPPDARGVSGFTGHSGSPGYPGGPGAPALGGNYVEEPFFEGGPRFEGQPPFDGRRGPPVMVPRTARRAMKAASSRRRKRRRKDSSRRESRRRRRRKSSWKRSGRRQKMSGNSVTRRLQKWFRGSIIGPPSHGGGRPSTPKSSPWVSYYPGELPIILTTSHDGNLHPVELGAFLEEVVHD